MNLFNSSGVDLPTVATGAKRIAPRLPHLPLFAKKVIERRLGEIAINPTLEQQAIASDYVRLATSAPFTQKKETEVRPIFVEKILCGILGYQVYRESGEHSLAFERAIRRGSVDLALGQFFPDGNGDRILSPFEMKGPDTPDLDTIMAGRGKSPVQQAWEYAIDAPGAKWVLVSNCKEIRLYGFGRGRDAYELFDLTRLNEPNELKRLLMILGERRFLGGETEQLLRDTDATLKDITYDLYKDYSDLRMKLLGFLIDAGDGPKLARANAIEVAQKLLDRILFIAFAGANRLLPDSLLKRAAETVNDFNPTPLWANFHNLFRAVDTGSKRLDIWGYNGGLFAFDASADTVELPDTLATEMAALGRWDFASEVPVTVLGHIFEQSITDIEKLREGEVGEQPTNKRKRDGVVYTPDGITRFLVERTIDVTLAERFADLLEKHAGLRAYPENTDQSPFPDEEIETAFWLEYLETLRDLTIVDPACGSGAFLVAAFDSLAAEYRRVTERLSDLGVKTTFDIYDEILTKNLYGVDLNMESVEISRLSLWLKTARRQYRLQSLDENILGGNSLIDDAKVSDRPFNWQSAFPHIFARGGFDIVLGNPPYVRMEFLKPIKPWLSKHYSVADERSDLYAYFFEKAVQLLKNNGRLGYISSSTFFRTGSGEKLRLLLAERTNVEAVIDFGDVQIFEGVTTYPAILIASKRETISGAGAGNLRFLNIKHESPVELGATFETEAIAMPRAQLTGSSWQFENAPLAALRQKIVTGRKTLGEVYGVPMRGIVTGLNDAFIISQATRDKLIAADTKSADLLKPFLKGENVKRWRVEREGLWLINTPKGKVNIKHYPAIRNWLLPFKKELENRATKQEWWELQQAQLAYQERLGEPKICWPHFQLNASFTLNSDGNFLNNKCFFFANSDLTLLSLLNSKLIWWTLLSISRVKRGGYIEAEAQYVETLPFPDMPPKSSQALSSLSEACTKNANKRLEAQQTFLRRLPDLGGRDIKPSGKLERFWELDFTQFLAEIKRVFKADIALKARGEWQAFHAEQSALVKALNSEIEQAERKIDALVYEAFELSSEEIEILEQSLSKD